MSQFLLLLLFALFDDTFSGVFKSLGSRAYPWTNNTVYYFFDPKSNYTEHEKNVVQEAVDVLRKDTCVEFIEGSTEKHAIKIIKAGDTCASDIGSMENYPNQTPQTIDLAERCLHVIGITIHEFLHALGLLHAHSRHDRDDFILINRENIKEGEERHYRKLDTLNITPYDYNSYMHYGSVLPGNDPKKPAMMTKDTKYRKTIGNLQGSFYDFHAVNLFYKCYDKCPSTKSASCTNGGVPHPRDCQKCLCPFGFGGKFCDELPGNCGKTFDLIPSDINTINLTIGDTTRTNWSHVAVSCTYWFRPPPGYKTMLFFQTMESYGHNVNETNESCTPFGWQFKINKDPRLGGPMFCENTDRDVTLVSDLNPAPLILHSHQGQQIFTFQYQAVRIGNNTNCE